jgi:hypothetical protein
MEKKFTLVSSLLFVCLFSFAAAPTVSSSNLEYTVTEGDKLTLRFQKGNGQFRIVVMKEGSAIGALPVNGTDYTPSAAFGLPASAFTNNDGFVVYEGSSAATLVTVPVTNLKPATTYYISVFEFNGTGNATEYYMVALTGSRATISAPTSQGSFKPFTEIVGNSVKLNWNFGNGARRLIVARKANAVNAEPVDLQAYTGSNDFGLGNVVSGDNYVVYSGSGNTSITINQLEPNTTYHFALFEYNGSAAPLYLKPSATTSVLTNAGPTKAAGPISFPTVDGNRLTLNFSRGNGKHQLIIGRKGQPVTAQPVNGELYDASTEFGDGEEIADGQFVLNSLNNDRTFTNLDLYSTYHFRIYEFDIDAAGNTYYLTSLSSSGSSSTAMPPTQQVDGITMTAVTGSSMSFTYTPRDSRYRLIVVKAGSAVDAIPVDLIEYTGGNAQYGQGAQMAPGNYIIYGGTNSSSASISGLTPGVTYHIAIWGWNGFDFPIYKQDPARHEVTIPNEPSAPATGFSTGSVEGNAFYTSWSGGDGARRLVIARKGAAVTARPADGQTYTADADFDEGFAIEPGQFVVHDGTARAFTVKKLEAASTYHFAVFEYNVTNGQPDYRISTFLAGQGTTVAAPTAQATINSVDQVQATSARINFTKGDGSQRIFVMREHDAVNTTPVDFTGYSWSSTFRFGTKIGDANYVVAMPTSAVSPVVSGLTPNTTYHIAVFEFNGSAAPVYLRPGATYQFTTAAGGGVTAPTTNASNPSFEVDGNKLNFSWQKGDGSKRIVVLKQGTGLSFQPADGTDYAAGTDLGGGQSVVYNGSLEEALVTGLQPSTNYSLAVFEYNGTGASIRYLVAGALSVQQSTAVTPGSGSTSPVTQSTSTTIKLSWSDGDGDRRLVVMKEGAAITGEPADLSKYPASNEFKQGSQIAEGEYVVYAGIGSTVTVTGLDPLKTYHFSVFEYNGLDAPIYNRANELQGQATTTGALPLTWIYFNVKEKQGGVVLKWGTTDEVNTAYFVIERSAGGPFTALDSIAAKNTAGDHDYEFTDQYAPAGLVQYRIKQVDIDRRYEYSRVVQINLAARQNTLGLFPNPAKESLKIVLPAAMNRARLTVYDAGGRQVMNKMVNNGEVIAVGNLRQGIYTVMVEDGERKLVERLMKL